MKKLLNRRPITIAILALLSIAIIAIAQSPSFRPAIGIPGALEEIRLTCLALAQQQHAEIAAQIASETASAATHVFTSEGYILEATWLSEAQAALDYWADRIAALSTP